jgi:hypothetical protein
MDIGCGIPAQYDYINIANASQSPSTIHCRNTKSGFLFPALSASKGHEPV